MGEQTDAVWVYPNSLSRVPNFVGKENNVIEEENKKYEGLEESKRGDGGNEF